MDEAYDPKQEVPAERKGKHKKAKSWDYDKEIKRLQIELANLQAWVKKSGARIVIIFEGRDAAGKGGMIKRITEKVSPRVFRVVALPAPTDREKTQIYMQRYIAHLPAAGEVAYRWVNEDYDSPDGIPYAGQLDRKAPRLYVATGFNGWGISNGTAAARLIADQVLGAANAWATLYDPQRRSRKINDGGDTKSKVSGVEGIRPGEGGVIDYGKKKIAIWKSPRGQVHAFDAACTHKGCTLTWNGALRQWDCPCHGSMFTCKGEVIHGPATDPLKPAKLPRA